MVVHTFVVSGGPCSGKTTTIALLQSAQGLLFGGTRLLVAPEAATLYHSYGGRLPFATGPSVCGMVSADERVLLWELMLNELKRSLEARCINEALGMPGRTVVLCDRGIFDSRAYLPSEDAFKEMLSLATWTEESIAARYDHAFHLAMCPEWVYQRSKNAARRESYEEALALDGRTWDAWERSKAGAHTRIEGADGTLEAKAEALATSVQWLLRQKRRPPPKRQSWSLPIESTISLADALAAAPDLRRIAPASVAIVRRVQAIDAELAARRGVLASEHRRAAWRAAAAVGQRMLERRRGSPLLS